MGADSPVYKVEPEGKKGKARILHRNLLLPCSDLPIVDDQVDQKKMKPTLASGKDPFHSNMISLRVRRKKTVLLSLTSWSFCSRVLFMVILHQVLPQARKRWSMLVIPSYPSLCRPMRKTVLIPPTYLSLYQRVRHKSMRPPLYHDHKESENHH